MHQTKKPRIIKKNEIINISAEKVKNPHITTKVKYFTTNEVKEFAKSVKELKKASKLDIFLTILLIIGFLINLYIFFLILKIK